MSTSFIKLPKAGSGGPGENRVQMLELALPMPLDQQEKVRALNYLHGAVQQYIDEFCGGNPPDQRSPISQPPKQPAQRSRGRSVSLPQAIQVFLCFYLCLFI